jgi:hypothetical protein
MTHKSDSLEQRRAEPVILKGVTEQLAVELAPRRLHLGHGAAVDVDGVAASSSAESFDHGRGPAWETGSGAAPGLRRAGSGRTQGAGQILRAVTAVP